MKQRFLCLLLSAVLLLSLVSMASAETPTAVITTPQQAAPGVSLFSTGDSTAGHHLQGNDQKIYEALISLVQKIAKGDRSCTILRVGSVPDAISKEYPLDASVDIDFDSNLMNFRKILAALLADCPYEMYWYDKTKTGGCRAEIRSGTYGNSKFTQITFYFSVEESYFDTSSLAEGEQVTERLYVDTQKAATTAAAIDRAKKIVETHKDKDDYSKLLAYKNEICDLVSYNHDAANNNSTPYGDPWQLIYVFDGDPNTNVVCEGYSKAFQYLCDNTEFQSDLIQCYTVSGQMYAVSPGVVDGGGHMWNIVTMEDGKHYLVDVTNSDEGSIGEDGELFLAGTPLSPAGSAGGMTVSKNWHFFKIDQSYVHFIDDSDQNDGYGEENGYWDDSVLLLSETNYVYNPVCDYTKAEIDVEKKALVLPSPVRENETVYAVVYENGKMVDMKVMRVGESTMDISDLHGDEIKAFFLNSSSKAPLAPNQKENWDH